MRCAFTGCYCLGFAADTKCRGPGSSALRCAGVGQYPVGLVPVAHLRHSLACCYSFSAATDDRRVQHARAGKYFVGRGGAPDGEQTSAGCDCLCFTPQNQRDAIARACELCLGFIASRVSALSLNSCYFSVGTSATFRKWPTRLCSLCLVIVLSACPRLTVT